MNWKILTKSPYISSDMIGSLLFSAIARMSCRCFAEKTEPQGFDGLLTIIHAVLWSIKDSR